MHLKRGPHLPSDMTAIESFHTKCQRRILGIRWHDFVRNSEVSLRTGLAPVSDWITRVAMPYSDMWQDCHSTLQHSRPCYAKSSYRLVDPLTLHGNVHQVDHVPNGPTNSAAITTMFPLRLWRQAIGRGHSTATLLSEPTMR